MASQAATRPTDEEVPILDTQPEPTLRGMQLKRVSAALVVVALIGMGAAAAAHRRPSAAENASAGKFTELETVSCWFSVTDYCRDAGNTDCGACYNMEGGPPGAPPWVGNCDDETTCLLTRTISARNDLLAHDFFSTAESCPPGPEDEIFDCYQ